jgi:saccharopine dehydrogenase (NAD+, L-lysine-forming)
MAMNIWLRAESKPHEKRTALTPASAEQLVRAGFNVSVERSSQSCIPASAYEAVGCTLVAEASWPDAPDDTFILGLKELPEDGTPLRHRHIYFAHAYKQQAGWREALGRFTSGGGTLYDLEFLVDETGRRVAAFGYWAGFAGAAVALKAWCGQMLDTDPVVPALADYDSRNALVAELEGELASAREQAGRAPRIMVIGARGRSGSGAVDLAKSLGLEVTEWDMAETAAGGPFAETVEHDVFVNCVLVFSAMPPFISNELVDRPGRVLSVISDVSCDPFGDYNPVPLYDRCTTFEAPALRLREGLPPLDLIAIDHLPSMLPVESSGDFSSQLLATLLELDRPGEGVWGRAADVFNEKIKTLQNGS